MTDMSKGKSPFFPGQPVPVEFFVGRKQEIDRLISRGVAQVALGKPVAVYTQGEYGIGKSSIAGYVGRLSEAEYQLHLVYASLGGCTTIEEVVTRVVEATVKSGVFFPDRGEAIRNWLGKYIGDQSLFGINVNLSELRKDVPSLSSPQNMLGFLEEAYARLKSTGVKGLFLVLDEINGISREPKFANFIKGVVDSNALSRAPLPFLLMLCGVEERRREMIQAHPPVDRIFDIVEVGQLSEDETAEFFTRAFDTVGIKIDKDAMSALTYNSAGFPKIMHLVGDAAFWLDRDSHLTLQDAISAVITAAEDVGRKYVDQQVYKALKSEDYHAILAKIAGISLYRMSFMKSEIEKQLSPEQKKKLNNFLQRMKKLNVLRSGDSKGEYVFNQRMVALYVGISGGLKKKRV